MTAGWGKALAPDMFPALSLRQPWAWAVLSRGKHVENRVWSTAFRGEFLIHASGAMTRNDYEDGMNAILAMGGDAFVPGRGLLERGGFVGVARLVDVLPPCLHAVPPCQRQLGLGLARPCDHPWHMPEQYGFVLADVRPVTFTPWKGCLGFFGVPRDVALPLIGRSP